MHARVYLLTAMICLGLTARLHGQLDPQEALAALEPASDLRVQLFAAEPQLHCPTCFDIDDKGRIWLVEGVHYRGAAGPRSKEPPYFLKPARPAGDRIMVLEDTDGDGRCDSSRVFYEGLDINSSQGFAVIGDKVWVSQSPNIFTIEIKPDGTAGKKEILLTGFNGIHGDHSVHSVYLGPDGKLYNCFGDTGCKTTFPDGKTLVTDGRPYRGACVYRMNHDLSGVEVLGHNFRNGYECATNSFGTTFHSDNDDDEGNQYCRFLYVMEGGNFGYQPIPPRGLDWNLESAGVVPYLMRTGAGAPAGMCVYEGKLLPAKYRGMPLLVDCGTGRLQGFALEPHGAGYRAKGVPFDKDNDPIEALRQIAQPDILLASKDRWFRPADVAVAPDGSIFVADFYNRIAGGRNSTKWEGRIWRLIPKDHDGRYKVAAPDVNTPEGLSAALGSPNLHARSRAILAIKAKGKDAIPLLARHVRGEDRILRARVLFQLGTLGPDGQKHVRAALADEDPDFRILALRSLRQNGADMVEVGKSLVRDPSPAVRREVLLSLRDADAGKAAPLLVELANQADPADRFYLEAVGIACRDKEKEVLPLLSASWQNKWDARVAALLWILQPADVLTTLTTIANDAQRPMADRALALRTLCALDSTKAGDLAIGYLDARTPKELRAEAYRGFTAKADWRWRGLARRPELLQAAERDLGDADLKADALALSRKLGTRPLVRYRLSPGLAANQPDRLDHVFPTETVKEPERMDGWNAAKVGKDGIVNLQNQCKPNSNAVAYAATILEAQEPVETRLLVGSEEGIKIWLNGKPVFRSAAARQLAPRSDVFPVRFEKGLNRLVVKSTQSEGGWAFLLEVEDPFSRLKEVTEQSLPKIAAPPGERLDPKNLAEDKVLLALKGNAARGRDLFLRSTAACVKCHQVAGEGNPDAALGPALDGIGKKMGKDALLEAMVRPGQTVLPIYLQWQVATKAGKVYLGVIAEETPERLVLVDNQGSRHRLAKSDIETKTQSKQSAMPEGLLGELSKQDLADLLEFLSSLK
ncbi:MAG: PVC-type heme-binding CxxCH protein [Gemmataceae bacterium]